jgi:hypothetical protein
MNGNNRRTYFDNSSATFAVFSRFENHVSPIGRISSQVLKFCHRRIFKAFDSVQTKSGIVFVLFQKKDDYERG